MKKLLMYLIIFLPYMTYSQVRGTVTNNENNKKLPFVNIWVKNTLLGTTSDQNGKFTLKKAKPGDSLIISSVGFNKIEFIAKVDNNIKLIPKIQILEDIVIVPKKGLNEYKITSFKRPKRNRQWYNNGHYSIGRYFEYNAKYQNTPFISRISIIYNNSKKSDVLVKVKLLKSSKNGYPSNIGLSENKIITCKKGMHVLTLDIENENIIFPPEGFFVVIDRLNIDGNKQYNKVSKIDIIQPAIGLERMSQKTDTWISYGGRWYPPNEIKSIVGTDKNVAINIDLTD